MPEQKLIDAVGYKVRRDRREAGKPKEWNAERAVEKKVQSKARKQKAKARVSAVSDTLVVEGTHPLVAEETNLTEKETKQCDTSLFEKYKAEVEK